MSNLSDPNDSLTDEQKRRLRAVRRGYRAASAEIKGNGWQVEVVYMDGSKVTLNAKLLKLRAAELQGELQGEQQGESEAV